MSSDEDDERVKLYNPLERNRKRQHFGARPSLSPLLSTVCVGGTHARVVAQ